MDEKVILLLAACCCFIVIAFGAGLYFGGVFDSKETTTATVVQSNAPGTPVTTTVSPSTTSSTVSSTTTKAPSTTTSTPITTATSAPATSAPATPIPAPSGWSLSDNALPYQGRPQSDYLITPSTANNLNECLMNCNHTPNCTHASMYKMGPYSECKLYKGTPWLGSASGYATYSKTS